MPEVKDDAKSTIYSQAPYCDAWTPEADYLCPPLFNEPSYKIKIVHNVWEFFACIAIVFIAIACVAYGLGYMTFEKFAPRRLQEYVYGENSMQWLKRLFYKGTTK
jgi:hypothetical protein